MLNSSQELINIAEIAINAAAAGTYKLYCNGTANFADAVGVGGAPAGDDLITVGDGTASDGEGVRIWSDRPMLRLHEEDQTNKNWQIEGQGGDFRISTQTDAFNNISPKLTITNAGAATFSGALTVNSDTLPQAVIQPVNTNVNAILRFSPTGTGRAYLQYGSNNPIHFENRHFSLIFLRTKKYSRNSRAVACAL